MCKCILARTQQMRQSDEVSAKHGKVSNHGYQLLTKAKTSEQVDLQPWVGRTAKGRRITSPFKGRLIWGKIKWKKYASKSSGSVYHMYMTVMWYSLIAVKEGFSYGELRLLY